MDVPNKCSCRWTSDVHSLVKDCCDSITVQWRHHSPAFGPFDFDRQQTGDRDNHVDDWCGLPAAIKTSHAHNRRHSAAGSHVRRLVCSDLTGGAVVVRSWSGLRSCCNAVVAERRRECHGCPGRCNAFVEGVGVGVSRWSMKSVYMAYSPDHFVEAANLLSRLVYWRDWGDRTNCSSWWTGLR